VDDPQQHARTVLVRRLVERHGIDEATAIDAVDAARAGTPDEYGPLVATEAAAVLTEGMRPLLDAFAAAWQAIQPALQHLAQSVSRFAEQLEEADRLRAQDRPAWQSPYGPPTRRR
jgi:hypothetical protein